MTRGAQRRQEAAIDGPPPVRQCVGVQVPWGVADGKDVVAMSYTVKTRTVMRVLDTGERTMHVAELFADKDELVCSAEGFDEVEALRYLDWAVERMHSEQSTAVAKVRRGR